MLARGWERQLDLDRNAILYDDELNHADYAQWLHDNAARFLRLT